jgi:hypothetical protein
LTHAISGEAFTAESVSSESALKLVSKGNFEGAFATKAGAHSGQYTVQITNSQSFTEPYSYVVSGKANIQVEEDKNGVVKVKVSIEGKGKKEADNVFIELTHKSKKNVHYYKYPTSHSGESYTINYSLDESNVSGDYEATLVVVDGLLQKESRK